MATSLTNPGLIVATDKAIIGATRAIAKVTEVGADFSADAVVPNTSIKIPVYGGGTAGTFDATNNNYAKIDGSIAYATLVLNQHIKHTFGFTDKDATLVGAGSVWQRSGEYSGRAISKAIETATFGLLAAASAGSTTTLAVSKANIASLRKVCTAADVDPANSVLVLTPDAFSTLLGQLDANVYGGREAIANGVIHGLYGFKSVIESGALPTTSNQYAAIVPDGALAVAGRTVPVLSPSVYQEVGTTTDDATGLVLGARRFGSAATGENFATIEALFGAALTYDQTNCPNAPQFIAVVSQ